MSVDILIKVFFSAIAVAIVFVCEAGWSLAKAAVRNWIDMVRQAKAAAEEDERLRAEEEDEKAEDQRARERPAPEAAKRIPVSGPAEGKQSVPQDAAAHEQPRNAVPEVAAESAPVGVQKKDTETSWESIQQMPHNFIPDPDEDYEYLHRMNDMAKSGRVEAMVKLSEYARRRNADVESYYWLKMAKIHGAEDVDEALKYCLKQWRINGFNPEYENEYVFFTERQGVLGRAALRLDSGVDATMARARLKDMIAAGDQEAKLVFEHCGG